MPPEQYPQSWNSVENWVKAVTASSERIRNPAVSSHHPMRLRSTALRLPLADSSGNIRARAQLYKNQHSSRSKQAQQDEPPQRRHKRKQAMADACSPEEFEERPIRRGRPPDFSKRAVSKSPSKMSTPSIDSAPRSLRHTPASTFKTVTDKSRSTSPKKKSAKTLDKAKADVTVDMRFLKLCQPSVTEMDECMAQETGGIPVQALKICSLFDNALQGFIPHELKVGLCIARRRKCKANHQK